MDLVTMREEFGRAGLDIADVDVDPIAQFQSWLEVWSQASPKNADTMVLSTVDADGWPSARAVLLKGVDSRGFVFFSNYNSDKGAQLKATRRAALSWVWREIERQVRVVGNVSQLPEAESDAYFASRPRGAQISAWTSDQSAVIASRGELEKRVSELESRYPNDVPRPPHWGGYIVTPRRVEFWQGRPDRLHDRICYFFEGDDWRIERLAP